MAMCGLPSNMKSSSHKTRQTSLLFLKPHQIQNLKIKKWGDMAYYVPPSEKMGEHVPHVPHQIAPMQVTVILMKQARRKRLSGTNAQCIIASARLSDKYILTVISQNLNNAFFTDFKGFAITVFFKNNRVLVKTPPLIKCAESERSRQTLVKSNCFFYPVLSSA